MVDDGAAPQPAQAWPARVLSGLSVGLALGAVALAGYAFTYRVPTGQSAQNMKPVTMLLGTSLALTILAALALVAVGLLALRGRPAWRSAAALLAAIAVAGAFVFLGSAVVRSRDVVSGPGAHPVIDLSQLGWATLGVAALLATAAAVTARGPARPPAAVATPATAAVIAVGLVAAVGAGYGIAAVADRGADHATTAEAIDMPAVPESLPGSVAFSLQILDSDGGDEHPARGPRLRHPSRRCGGGV